jgi:hypothetical protein
MIVAITTPPISKKHRVPYLNRTVWLLLTTLQVKERDFFGLQKKSAALLGLKRDKMHVKYTRIAMRAHQNT